METESLPDVQRRTNAIPVPVPDGRVAAISTTVDIMRDDERVQTFRIVGEEVSLPGGMTAEITAITPDEA